MSGKKMVVLFTFFFILSSIAVSATQEEQYQRRETVRHNINTLRLLRMTQALNLTEEQTAQIYPLSNRFEKEKMDIHRQIGRELNELRRLLKEEAASNVLVEKVKKIRELRGLVQKKDEEFDRFMDENLTDIQKAKYLLFSVDFYRGIGEKLERARMKQNRSQLPGKKEF